MRDSNVRKNKFTKRFKKINFRRKRNSSRRYKKYILEIVSKNGGHLASNLGVVELTIALHSVFDVPKDKIVWDVGHQTYVHKILTGRKETAKNIETIKWNSRISKNK